MAATNAERQARWRERQKAKLGSATSPPGSASAISPDHRFLYPQMSAASLEAASAKFFPGGAVWNSLHPYLRQHELLEKERSHQSQERAQGIWDFYVSQCCGYGENRPGHQSPETGHRADAGDWLVSNPAALVMWGYWYWFLEGDVADEIRRSATAGSLRNGNLPASVAKALKAAGEALTGKDPSVT